MAPLNNRLKIYIRANQLTDEVQARIFETGGSFTQHGSMGEGDHAVSTLELAHFDDAAWKDVASWMQNEGVDFNAEEVHPGEKT